MLKVKEIRNARGLSQKQLAELLGIKPNTLSQYENGIRNPSIATLVKMTEALDCDFNTLISSDRNKK